MCQLGTSISGLKNFPPPGQPLMWEVEPPACMRYPSSFLVLPFLRLRLRLRPLSLLPSQPNGNLCVPGSNSPVPECQPSIS